MAEEENKDSLKWEEIGIAVLLWFLSSIVVTQMRLFTRIPMGPQVASALSCISCVVATFLMASGTGQNPIKLITDLF